MPSRRGFKYNQAGTLSIYVDGTEAATLNDADPYLTVPAGLKVTSGTLNIDGAADFAADVKINLTLTAGADGVGTDGEQLTSGGAAAECDWAAAASLRRFKNILGTRNDTKEALKLVASTPVYDFKYKRRDESDEHIISTGDCETVYTGVIAEEAPWSTHYGGKIINPVNALGYTILAIRGLYAEVLALRKELRAAKA